MQNIHDINAEDIAEGVVIDFFNNVRCRTALFWLLAAIFANYLIMMISKRYARIGTAESLLVSNLLIQSGLAGWLFVNLRGKPEVVCNLIGSIAQFTLNRAYVFYAFPLVLSGWCEGFAFFVIRFKILGSVSLNTFPLHSVWTSQSDHSFTIVLLAIVVVFLAPVIEEFFFRGILLHRCAHKWGLGRSIIITSLLFGCLHDDLVYTTILGIAMSLLYLRTNSLYVTMTCHSLNNVIAVIIHINEAKLINSSLVIMLFFLPILCYLASMAFVATILLRLWREVKSDKLTHP
jgi:membrane protease YdiL (CAAX protease family)